jgi:hypothetical protein
MGDVTRILDPVQRGEAKAAEELLPLVYEGLRKLASHKMAQEAPEDQTSAFLAPRGHENGIRLRPRFGDCRDIEFARLISALQTPTFVCASFGIPFW